LILYNWPSFRHLQMMKITKKSELVYRPIRKAPPISELIDKKQRLRKPSAPKIAKDASADIRKKGAKKPAPRVLTSMEKPQLKPLEIKKEDFLRHITSDEKVLISHKEKDLTDEPAYLDYYNAVRSKIYKAANANKPYYFMEGQVSLLFILARDGRLLNATVLDDGSTANPILRRHALSGINRASPFPPFHESIKEDHLTLRLTISFEK